MLGMSELVVVSIAGQGGMSVIWTVIGPLRIDVGPSSSRTCLLLPTDPSRTSSGMANLPCMLRLDHAASVLFCDELQSSSVTRNEHSPLLFSC